jgi:hypothetical protein
VCARAHAYAHVLGLGTFTAFIVMPMHFGEYLLLDLEHQKYTTSLSEHAYEASLLYMISVEMIEMHLLAMYWAVSILLGNKPLCNLEIGSFNLCYRLCW